ncbi:MAG: SGNH/GDSL hydrolase family protein [Algoriphagus sp.]|uniref:SGNH/GDSL hydrolase family protein n=1 Tax=Algoriphagus sp. TaxID=1872435 RepID=UPI00261B6D2F|nr:SGNH/GDSL hydrolase family protein [Algoriphagus sp.]MDG1277239.1 SGNH/GDSL hydrolase family protein [Algoriphagus sp.]
MKRFLIPILLLISIGLSSFIWKQKKILIIGDSISMGYTPYVWKSFQGKALVTHNPGNGQHTGTGLEKIEEWIGDEDWDLIQINWGLWDLAYRHPDSKVYGNRDKVNGKITFTVEEYAANLDRLITKIKKISDAKLVFVTTTYVPLQEVGRVSSDVEIYNSAAKEVMKRHGVLVNDIYTASVDIHKEHGQGNADVHYSEKGYTELGKLVVAFLSDQLF